MTHTLLIGWLIFVALVYFIAWFDYAWYEYDIPTKYHKILDAFTEEE